MVQGQPERIVFNILSQKYLTQKMAGGVGQVVECLPSKHAALSSNPNNNNKKDSHI
jgi:hypothetical protein